MDEILGEIDNFHIFEDSNGNEILVPGLFKDDQVVEIDAELEFDCPKYFDFEEFQWNIKRFGEAAWNETEAEAVINRRWFQVYHSEHEVIENEIANIKPQQNYARKSTKPEVLYDAKTLLRMLDNEIEANKNDVTLDDEISSFRKGTINFSNITTRNTYVPAKVCRYRDQVDIKIQQNRENDQTNELKSILEAHNSNAKSIRLAASSDKSSYITSHLKKHAPSNLNHDPKMKSNLNSTKINSNTNIRNKPPVFPQKSKSINLTKPVMKVPNVSSSIHAPNSKNKNISHVSDKSKSANSIAQPRSITSFSRMTQQKLPVRLNMKSARSSGDLDDEMDLLKLLQFHNQNVSNRKC